MPAAEAGRFLCRDSKTALIWIIHDLAVVAGLGGVRRAKASLKRH
jgi:hypothetical protein